VVIGLQDGSDATIETLKAIEYLISKQAQILVEACSFAGTGNVLRLEPPLVLPITASATLPYTQYPTHLLHVSRLSFYTPEQYRFDVLGIHFCAF
jgi:hypothetical protein